jgi:hypothetical protein
MDDHEDLRCPGCDNLASRTLSSGWLFRCAMCDWDWGHPQSIDRVKATEMLHDARNACVPKFGARDTQCSRGTAGCVVVHEGAKS